MGFNSSGFPGAGIQCLTPIPALSMKREAYRKGDANALSSSAEAQKSNDQV
jgi:hypothetical protein